MVRPASPFGRLTRLSATAGVLVLLAACSAEVEPAADAGVCWRVRDTGGAAPAREVLDRVDNMQTCASRLEAVRMMEGVDVEGAFEGRSIFASEAALTQSPSRTGTRYPVFEPAERARVQAAIQQLLDRRSQAR
jgi:hypothetical protein